MDIREFDYDLPLDLIAQHPEKKRDCSRLMVLNREDRSIEHRLFFEIADYFRPGDVLVLNDTRVIPARLVGKKQSGGRAEVFLLTPHENGEADESTWNCLVKCSKKPKPRTKIFFDTSLTAEILGETEEGFTVKFNYEGTFEEVLDRIGITPLPPYIKRENGSSPGEKRDRERYQTVFARSRGAVAAPTAGLHFTSELLDRIKATGVDICYITLHVGWGTFQPVRAEKIEKHRMHSECFTLTSSTAKVINDGRKRKARIVGAGSTTTRTLEYAAADSGAFKPSKGYTDLFIYPGYNFKAIDSLITNFHVPRSTLLMLVSAFAGREFILEAYREAINKGYRFYSYGDAMMII